MKLYQLIAITAILLTFFTGAAHSTSYELAYGRTTPVCKAAVAAYGFALNQSLKTRRKGTLTDYEVSNEQIFFKFGFSQPPRNSAAESFLSSQSDRPITVYRSTLYPDGPNADILLINDFYAGNIYSKFLVIKNPDNELNLEKLRSFYDILTTNRVLSLDERQNLYSEQTLSERQIVKLKGYEGYALTKWPDFTRFLASENNDYKKPVPLISGFLTEQLMKFEERLYFFLDDYYALPMDKYTIGLVLVGEFNPNGITDVCYLVAAPTLLSDLLSKKK